MSDKNEVRLKSQLRLLRAVQKKGGFIATALPRRQVARILGCSSAEVERLEAIWELRPLRNDGGFFPVSQVQDFIAKRSR